MVGRNHSDDGGHDRFGGVSPGEVEMSELKNSRNVSFMDDNDTVNSRTQLIDSNAPPALVAFADDDEERPDQLDLLGSKLGNIVKQTLLARYDRHIRFLNLWIAFFAALGIVIMMFEVWIAFDKDAKEFTSNTTVLALKAACSLSTLILLILLTSYYRFQLGAEQKSWFINDSVTWRHHYRWFFLAEVFICLIHPFPDFDLDLYDDQFGMFMFLRAYLLVRVFRDWAPIYQRRLELLTDPFLRRIGAVEFNWQLCAKFYFLQHMWVFVVFGVLFAWFLMAYIIWVFERSWGRDTPLTLQLSIWMTCVTMTTVGYGDITPESAYGQAAAGVATVLGLILASLLVFAVMDSLTYSQADKRVTNLLLRLEVGNSQRELAATYIQVAYRQYRHKIEYNDIKNPEYLRLLRLYNTRNSQLKSRLRSFRRIIQSTLELDDVVIARLEERMDTMSAHIARQLSSRLGMPPVHMNKRVYSLVELTDQLEVLEDRQQEISQKLVHVLDALKDNSSFFGIF